MCILCLIFRNGGFARISFSWLGACVYDRETGGSCDTCVSLEITIDMMSAHVTVQEHQSIQKHASL
jgi:hypothetical protein